MFIEKIVDSSEEEAGTWNRPAGIGLVVYVRFETESDHDFFDQHKWRSYEGYPVQRRVCVRLQAAHKPYSGTESLFWRWPVAYHRDITLETLKAMMIAWRLKHS